MKLYTLMSFTMIMSLALSGATMAQSSGLGSSDDPLEVTADGSLEWNRAKSVFVARENAKARQGTGSIEAQILTALYRESDESSIDIYEIKADTNVVLHNQDSVAYGDNAVYDLDKGYAELTGQNLKLVSPDQTITARKRFEYWVNEGRAVAIGRPRVIRPKTNNSGAQDTLDADKVTAKFKDNATGQRVIDTLEAHGNVIITTPTEIMTGAYGIYRASTNKAEITGGVTITRGPNILEGERAIVDLTTNISQIFGGQNQVQRGAGGRVRGVFYPSSDKKKDTQVPKPTPTAQPPAIPQQPKEFAPLTRP